MSAKLWMYSFIDTNLRPNHSFYFDDLSRKFTRCEDARDSFFWNHEDYYYDSMQYVKKNMTLRTKIGDIYYWYLHCGYF